MKIQEFLNKFNTGERLENRVDKKGVVRKLIQESSITHEFYFLVIISTLITTLGLLIDNYAVVIGGMLIAPLLYPAIAFGLTITTKSLRSLVWSSWTLVKTSLLVILLSFLTTIVIDPLKIHSPLKMIDSMKMTPIFVYIATLSGIAATYAWIKPRLSATLPGVAISVSLLPPLCTVGIALSLNKMAIAQQALGLYILNIIGIAIASIVVFSSFGFTKMKKEEEKEIDRRKDS